MDKNFITKSIEIKAPVAKVWKVFTDPLLTRQMGGEYVSDWKVGSSFGWKALDGKMYTNGKIIEIIPEKLLKHNNYSLKDTKQTDSTISVLTYEFREKNKSTVIYAREDFTTPIDDFAYSRVSDGWNEALADVKEVAERLARS